ncbi:MAG: N-acetylneuraminate synthase family protein [Magnetospirillum sp. WYHS-4]
MTAALSLESKAVGPGQPCFVIAEVGVNHNGDMDLALRMIDAAADAGVDAIKFQTFKAEEFVNSPDEVYEYISQGQAVRESMLAMFRRLELPHAEHARLFAHARARGLVPFSTPGDGLAVELLDRLEVAAYKLGSDDFTYLPFLADLAARGKPLIISTGMADTDDIDRAVSTIRSATSQRFVLLHCVSEYPAPDTSVNLRKMAALRERTGEWVGFSDHSEGITAALGAVALGACVIEKHFTLDRNLPGPDHRFSADPVELTALVREVRRLEAQMGISELVPTPAEIEMRKLARRSIVAARDLPAGTVLAPTDLAFRRPGTGLMPYQADLLLGRRLLADSPAGTLLGPDRVDA